MGPDRSIGADQYGSVVDMIALPLRQTAGQPLFLNSPISTSLLVIINNGNIENGRAKAKNTCEFSIKRFKAVCC